MFESYRDTRISISNKEHAYDKYCGRVKCRAIGYAVFAFVRVVIGTRSNYANIMRFQPNEVICGY